MNDGSLMNADKYTSPVSHLVNTYIREYDIRKANINILYAQKVISLETYTRLMNSPKLVREKEIGLMQRNDPKISKALSNGFIKARKDLFFSNGMNEYQVLAIKKDAVFTIDKVLSNTKFDNIEFALKNIYTSYYHIYNYEIYYSHKNDGNYILDVKGIGDDSLELHETGIASAICEIFRNREMYDLTYTITSLKDFITQYTSRNLPIQYYREFNNRSLFKTMASLAGSDYYIDIDTSTIFSDDEKDIKSTLDIGYNYNFLCKIYQMYLDEYFYQSKR